ncbi:MAG: hypothetical protein RL685_4568 [Pseudomonadota bacterium]
MELTLPYRAGCHPTLSRAALTEQIEAYGAARLSRYFVHLYDDPQLFALGFHLPPLGGQSFASVLGRRGWHGFVATEGELAVAAGLLFVAGDAGYLGGGVTRPEHRGRGAQQRVAGRALSAGARSGLSPHRLRDG